MLATPSADSGQSPCEPMESGEVPVPAVKVRLNSRACPWTSVTTISYSGCVMRTSRPRRALKECADSLDAKGDRQCHGPGSSPCLPSATFVQTSGVRNIDAHLARKLG